MAYDFGRRVLTSLPREVWISLWTKVAKFMVFKSKPKPSSLLRIRVDTGSVRLDLQLPPETDPALLRLAFHGMKALLNNQPADDEHPSDISRSSATSS